MTQSLSPLLNSFYQFVSRCSSVNDLNRSKFVYPLHLAVLTWSPYLYVTDGLHSMQAELDSANIEQPIPFNQQSTIYYFPTSKRELLLNFHDLDIGQPTDYPHPYEPYYHFRDDYNGFLQRRAKNQANIVLPIIKIDSWGIKAVNLNRSGYYTPLLCIDSYKKERGNVVLKQKDIGSILYNQKVQQKMQQMRLNDMRIRKRCCENLKVSLCYYLRNKDDVKVRQIKYVILDSEQEILKTNYQQPIKYVPIGDIEGIGYFKYALNIATENLHTFMEINEKAIQRMLTTNNKQQNSDNSPESISELSNNTSEESSKCEVSEVQVLSVSDDSSEDDILRKVYMHELNKPIKCMDTLSFEEFNGD